MTARVLKKKKIHNTQELKENASLLDKTGQNVRIFEEVFVFCPIKKRIIRRRTQLTRGHGDVNRLERYSGPVLEIKEWQRQEKLQSTLFESEARARTEEEEKYDRILKADKRGELHYLDFFGACQ